MKLVKLSLVAALAAGSFSALNAVALEDAIKNVEISGMMRYRYDSVGWDNPSRSWWVYNDSRVYPNKANGRIHYSAMQGGGANSTLGEYDLNPNGLNAAGLAGSQRHHFRAFVTPKIDVGDNFKFIGQVMYNNDTNDGYGAWSYNSATGSKTFGRVDTVTKNAIVLKQAYMQYDAADAGVSVILGKQPLNTIWTNDFTGVAAKVLFTPTQGLTFAVFAVDSFEGPSGDGDAANFAPYGRLTKNLLDNKAMKINLMHSLLGSAHGVVIGNPAAQGSNFGDPSSALTNRLYQENMYGAAALMNFGGLDLQLWGNYWDKTAILYAANLNYKIGLGGSNNVGVKVTYLGNSLQNDLKDIRLYGGNLAYTDNDGNAATTQWYSEVGEVLGDGSLVDARLFANVAGLDAQIGGIMFGKKDKLTLNTLEEVDTPAGLYIGREIFYTQGSWTVISSGQNTFGYVGAGYTLPSGLRIGVQGVFGKNVMTDGAADVANNGDTFFAADAVSQRYELSADVSYKVNKNLSFLAYYSYLDITNKDAGKEYTYSFGNDGTMTGVFFSPVDEKYKKQTVRLQALYKF